MLFLIPIRDENTGYQVLYNNPNKQRSNIAKAKSLDENSTARAKGFYSKFSRPKSETDMILEWGTE